MEPPKKTSLPAKFCDIYYTSHSYTKNNLFKRKNTRKTKQNKRKNKQREREKNKNKTKNKTKQSKTKQNTETETKQKNVSNDRILFRIILIFTKL